MGDEKLTPPDETERYKKFLRVVMAQTGGSSLPIIIRKSAIATTFYSASYDWEGNELDEALESAVNSGHIIIRMGKKEPELAITVAGSKAVRHIYPYRQENISDFEEILAEEKQSESPSDQIITWAENHIEQIKQNDR